MFRYKRSALVVFMILLWGTISLAQDNICQALVEQVLRAIMENCANREANALCYAHPHVAISEDNEFTSSGQQLPINQPAHIKVGKPSLDDAQWGVVVMDVQPHSLTTDSSVLVLLFGSATLEPRILSDSVLLQFRTDFQPAPCDTTQPFLLLYTPGGRTAEISVNGALLEISGTVTLKWTNENSLTATVHQGQMQIVDAGLVQSQQSVSAVMNNGVVLFWSAPRPINASEMQIGTLAQAAIAGLSGENVNNQPLALAFNPGNPQPVAIAANPAPCANVPIHTVVRGENLYRIALRYSVTMDSIVSANGISDPTQLNVGQQLTIPCGIDSGASSLSPTYEATCNQNTTHTVQRGENLYRIALQYGTTVDAITAANNITDPTLIHAGQQLVIPCSSGQTSPNTTNNVNPNAPDFCANIIASAPPEGLAPDMVNLYNQYCT